MGMMTDTPNSISTWCVPSSIFTATTWAMKTGNPVRIAIQKVDKDKDVDHSQAEALIDGKWTPLTEIWDGKSMTVKPWTRHFPNAGEPYRYVPLQDWMNEQVFKNGANKGEAK